MKGNKIMNYNVNTLKCEIDEYITSGGRITLLENESLKVHSSFKIGGAAKLYAKIHSADELRFLIEKANEYSVPYFVLGRGTNLLFADEGYNGIIISTEEMNGLSFDGEYVSADCGVTLSRCGTEAKARGLSGFECLYGIPGTVGGAVFMNAGAYGAEMKDIVVESTYFDVESGKVKTLIGEEHGFDYRHSVYRENRGVILSCKMKLSYGDVEKISAKMEECRIARKTKQPLEYPSAGSTFKRYPGKYTAQMIDEAGLKGFGIGGAQVSEKHAGFIINRGDATAKDVLELIDTVKGKIFELYGITIETEIIYVK